ILLGSICYLVGYVQTRMLMPLGKKKPPPVPSLTLLEAAPLPDGGELGLDLRLRAVEELHFDAEVRPVPQRRLDGLEAAVAVEDEVAPLGVAHDPDRRPR